MVCFPYTLTPSKLVDIYSVNEYSFDLPTTVAEKESFAGFVKSLTQSSLPEDDIRVRLKFESVLRYVACPSLPSDMSDIKKDHTDVQSVLEWLHERKRVESVMELRILDRLWGSHDEACIAYWLDEFKVSRAHWRCQDLSFYSFKDEVKKRLTSIHLYSSGKSAVHEYWFGSDHGLKSLVNVRLSGPHVIFRANPVPSFRKFTST